MSGPLPNPLHEIFAVEVAGGRRKGDAWVVIQEPRPLDSPRPPQRRSRVARAAIETIDERIGFLEALQTGPERDGGYLRDLRALAELRWCRGVIANGGNVPGEWFEECDEAAEDPE